MFIIKNKKIFIIISTTLVVLSIVFLFTFGLNLGIDFKGGALLEVSYPATGRPNISLLKEKVEELALGGVIIQPIGDLSYGIKTKALTEEEHFSLLKTLSLDEKYGAKEESFTSIGPSVGKELKTKVILALVIVILAIILFIAFVFRSVSKPVSSWKYGLIAVITLIHDILITTGSFVVISYFTGVETDTLFIVALLTILGLSINDTIVVFDRIRENLKNGIYKEFDEAVGRSIDQSFSRSINTSLTVIIVLIVLFFIGPETTKYFALTLAVGMFIGTYSSIFLASPLLVLLEQ